MSDEDTYMLTTVDNPFNPSTHYREWHAYDLMLGHNTASFLARVARTSDDLPEAMQRRDINRAIDEIVKENINGLYRKVIVEKE